MSNCIINDWKILSKEKTESQIDEWLKKNLSKSFLVETAAKYANSVLNAEYALLRSKLMICYNQASKVASTSQKRKYTFDLEFGIKSYAVLQQFGFNSRYASLDLVWYFIALNVIPDIIIKRFYDESKPESIKDHFFRKARRIYPKTLWWYIYLAQPNDDVVDSKRESEIRNLLKDNETDTILQMVERSGDFGYRRILYYEILRQYSMMLIKNPIRDFLRKVLILNTARTKIVEPSLFTGGVSGYVKYLFGYFNVQTK